MANTLVQSGSYVGSKRSEEKARSGQRFLFLYPPMAGSLSGQFERDLKATVITLSFSFSCQSFSVIANGRHVVGTIVYVRLGFGVFNKCY